MRTTKLLATVLVAGLIVSACQQDPDYVLPAIRVANTELYFSADTEQSLEFTATRDWRVRSKPDWVTVSPDQGSGSESLQRVRIAVDANPNYNRTGELILSIGLAKSTVAIIQPGSKGEVPVGSGTLEDPYTVKGAIAAVKNLTWTSTTDYQATEEVYVKGKIATVSEAFSAQYGNASFTIKGDAGEEVFTVYRALYLGNKKWTANDTQIKAGDEVIIKGKLMNYQGKTPETVANASFIYSLNGVTEGSGGGGNSGTPSGTGTLADPYNAAGANAYIETLADNAVSDKDVYIKGKISKIANNGEFGSYGNATFYISDDGNTGGSDFYCYRVLYLGNREWKTGDTQIKVGDDVIICGKVTKFVKDGRTTLETSQKEAYIYSLNGVTEGGSNGGGDEGGGGGNGGGGGSTVQALTVTITEFLAAQDSDTQKYQLTGKIANIVKDKNDNTKPNAYGNFDLVDDSGASVYVYGLTATEQGLIYENGSFTGKANNDKSFASLNLKEGDTLTLIGYHYTYNSKVEVLGAYYVSHTAGSN